MSVVIKMSEKRFIIVKSIENFYALVDKERVNKEQILILSLHKEQLGDVVDLLNELNDENKTLKKENEWLRKELKGLNKKYIAFSEATDKRLREMMK